MPPATSERRLQRVETKTTELAVSMASNSAKLDAVDEKLDTVLHETRALGSTLLAHAKDDAAVERRVTVIETTAAALAERHAETITGNQNMKIAMWTGAMGFIGSLILQLLTHFKVI